jgi:hypothetical protein
MMADACSAKEEYIAYMWCHMAEGAKVLWWDLYNSIIINTADLHKRIELTKKLDIKRSQFDEILEIRNVPILKKHDE